MSEPVRGKRVRFYRNYSTPIIVLRYLGRGGKKYFRVPSSNEQFVAGGAYGFLCVPVDLASEFLKLGKNNAPVFGYANPNQTRQVQDEIVRRYNLIQERMSKSGQNSDTAFDVIEDFFGNANVEDLERPPRLDEEYEDDNELDNQEEEHKELEESATITDDNSVPSVVGQTQRGRPKKSLES